MGTKELPQRPSLPPVLFVALSLWGSTAACLVCFQEVSKEYFPVAAVVLVVMAAVALTMVLKTASKHLLYLIFIGITLGAALALGSASIYEADQQNCIGTWGNFNVKLLEDASVGDYGTQCTVKARCPDGTLVKLRMYLSDESIKPRYGERALVKGVIKEPSDTSQSYYYRQGLVAQLRCSVYESEENSGIAASILQVRNDAIDALRPYKHIDKGLSAALLCGWREDFDEDMYQSFQVCGLAHIVAVSGAHLAIVISCISLVLERLRIPRLAAMVTKLCFVLLYLVFAGMPISAVRSAFMVVLALCSWQAKRRSAALSALSLCIVACIVADPYTALSVSFSLSALSTLGIVVFSRHLSFYISKAPFMPKFVCETLALTMSSMLVTAPLSAALFAKMPLISPLANIVIAPLFPFVCILGLLVLTTALCLSPLSACSLPLCAYSASMMNTLVDALARIPFASIPMSMSVFVAMIVSAGASIAFWLLWPSLKRFMWGSAFACFAVVISCVSATLGSSSYTSITMLDVGQGDAFLIQSAGYSLLIDTGNQETKLLEALARHNVTHVDALLVTHSDDDHMGCLSSLQGTLHVSEVLLGEGAKDCMCDNCLMLVSASNSLVGSSNVTYLSYGDEIRFGAMQLTAVWPHQYIEDGGNADSICLLARVDVDSDARIDWSALFVGDAEKDELDKVCLENSLHNIDILKVGHHGSKNGLTNDLVRILKPSIALISVGANNRYGHPNEQIVEWLIEAGSQVLRTDTQGDVSCVLEKDNIYVNTLR